ncbi:family 1 glycosylhydrolase [Enterococcus hirae]|uniref:glycoside hydrolase family 1 protein n=1 Tax=Enterococcus TaxID=1350 RepID=UPI0004D9C0FA|nr:glycoside hydrolase family 1 protein [Enterococcus hirae]KDR91957.1 6-phospho-beta-glucosidase [Enterococcus hirae]MDD9146435.1 glycoside hydrolase family 1 protein [Enterococcus hirae]NAA13014.1 family 1 glycosylhydrolase [Enterococcus hirae]NAA18176.1 family 1 glycosylhydrolase [Enterococcus hirae]NAA33497.1 family 1 glycosylhydrolase [Enterococcus hirae]
MDTFPQNFLWGAAASAPQTEGAALVDGKSPSTWDKWFEIEPELFHNGTGPENTSNTYYQYKEDVACMKAMNLNSYRTSIAWTRLLPDGKTLNPQAVDFYRAYFQEMLDNGIEPIINLFHFDMPWWLMEKGGWEVRESADHFAFYAKTAFEVFGDLVKKWATFNEPLVHIECGYMGDAHWPKVHDFKRAIQVAYHTLLAHAKAVKEYRRSSFNDGQISIILNLAPVYSKSEEAEDVAAAKWADLFYIRSFLDCAVRGTFPEELVEVLRESDLLPKTETGDKEIFAENTVDFIGCNYYQPLRVQAPQEKKRPITGLRDLFRGYDWPEKRINPHRGWEIYPRGIYDIAMRLKNSYSNIPWYISENGIGVSQEERFNNKENMIDDNYRIDFLFEHLTQLQQAISEGSPCFGYHMWTFADCWSWLNAYKNRYGFYRVDLDNGYKRLPKQSSLWMAQVIAENRLVEPFAQNSSSH